MNADKQKLIQLLSGNIKAESILNQQQAISTIIPEINAMIGMQQNNPNHCYTVWEHTAYSIAFAPDNIILRLTMLFHDIGKPACYSQDENGVGHFYAHPQYSAMITEKVLERLQFSQDVSKDIETLVFYHDVQIPCKTISIRRWLKKLGKQQFQYLIEVKKADSKAQVYSEKKEQYIKKLEQKLSEVLSQKFFKEDLAITGYDLMQCDIPQGKEIGKILNLLLCDVNKNRLQNEKQQLLQAAKIIYCDILEKNNKI